METEEILPITISVIDAHLRPLVPEQEASVAERCRLPDLGKAVPR
jgi:hypothetical protein